MCWRISSLRTFAFSFGVARNKNVGDADFLGYTRFTNGTRFRFSRFCRWRRETCNFTRCFTKNRLCHQFGTFGCRTLTTTTRFFCRSRSTLLSPSDFCVKSNIL